MPDKITQNSEQHRLFERVNQQLQTGSENPINYVVADTLKNINNNPEQGIQPNAQPNQHTQRNKQTIEK